MCSEMSHIIPNSAVTSETTMIPAGIAAHAGSPDTRCENRPSRASSVTFPERCPRPSHSSTAVTVSAAPEAIATWSSAAPPAGFAASKASMPSNVSSFDVTLCDVTPTDGTLNGVLTIDQLAQETGMSVRNVRSHHARGLLPPPEVRGRTGYYGPEHVERLRLIRTLQAEGMKLDGIKRLLTDPGDRLLALRRAAAEAPEAPVIVDGAELAERLRAGPEHAAQAERLGILRARGDGTFEVGSPSLLAAAEEVVNRGVSLEHALAMIESVMRHSRAVSREFIQLFLEDVWKPFAAAGMPEERWSELTDSIQHVRPLAAQALIAVFRRTMDEEIDATFAEILPTTHDK